MHATQVKRTWAEVGKLVAGRRERVLGMTAKTAAAVAGVSDTTWWKLESGEAVSARTRWKAAAALQWPDDALDLLAEGADPDGIETVPSLRPVDGSDHLDPPDDGRGLDYGGPVAEQIRWAIDPIKERDDRQDDRLDDHEARLRAVEDQLAALTGSSPSPAVNLARQRRARQDRPYRQAADTGNPDEGEPPVVNRPRPPAGLDEE